MAPDDPQPEPVATPFPFYIERNLQPLEFERWATGNSKDYLRSILAPPGHGKSTFLAVCAAQLRNNPQIVLFDMIYFDGSSSWENQLAGWLDGAIQQARDHPELRIDWIDYNPADGVLGRFKFFSNRLCTACGDHHTPILIIDTFDALDPETNLKLQEGIHSFVSRSAEYSRHARVIFAARDDFKLIFEPLRWVELGEYRLDPLLTPRVQIERRLRHAGAAAPGWPREEWEHDLDVRITSAALTEQQQQTLLDELEPSLTPNPYINLLLLFRELGHPGHPLTRVDYDWCLDQYLQRAVTADLKDFVIDLRAIPDFLATGIYRQATHNREHESSLDRLHAAGIAFVGKERRYDVSFEPGIVALLSHL